MLCDEGWGHATDYFYKYNVEITCAHTHVNSCYACGKEEHKHNDQCRFNAGMDSNLWKLNTEKTESSKIVAADGSTIINVYYDRVPKTLTFKYDYDYVYGSGYGYQKTETITAKWG